MEGISIIQCPALCIFSCPRIHQECVPSPWTSGFPFGGVSLEGVLAAQWAVQAASGCLWGIWINHILAWTHQHTPALPRKVWGWRVSFHRVRTLRGSLVRVCPAIQRLPVCLQDCPCVASEFLWLPFRLRKFTSKPYHSLSMEILTTVLALWDPCNFFYGKGTVPSRWHPAAAAETELLNGWWKTNLEEQNTHKQQGLPLWCLPGFREGRPLSLSHHCPRSWETKKGLSCFSLSLCASCCIGCCSLCWPCVTIALWTDVEDLNATIYNC